MTAEPTTVFKLLVAAVESAPSAPFLIDAASGEERSYQTVLDSALAWAAWFSEHNVRERIAVALPNSAAFVELSLGAALRGITLLAFNPALPPSELSAQLRHRRAERLFTTARHAPTLTDPPCPVVCVGERTPQPLPPPLALGSLAPVAADTALTAVLTSGTSGHPRTALVSHRGAVWSALRTREAFGIEPNTRYLTPLPLFHINAQVVAVLTALAATSAVALSPRLPAAQLFEAVQRTRAQGLSLVPALVYDLLRQEGSFGPLLRYAVCSSAALPLTWQRQFEERFGIPLCVCYGLSEASGLVTFSSPARKSPEGSVGRPIGCEVQISSEGELCLRSPALFLGYDQQPEESASTLRDGWLHTGDSATVDIEGFVFLNGRLKDLINRGGEKVSPLRVEEVLSAHPKISQVAVFAFPDERLGEGVAAAVVAGAPDLDGAAVLDFCDGKLPEYAHPSRVYFVASLPRGPTGKVLRRELLSFCEQQPGALR